MRWTREEDLLLETKIDSGCSYRELSKLLNRPIASVYSRYEKIKRGKVTYKENRSAIEESVRNLRESGMIIKDISEKLSISVNLVRRIINKMCNAKKRKRYSNKELNEIVEFYKSNTARETAKKFEISIPSVYSLANRAQVIKEYNIEIMRKLSEAYSSMIDRCYNNSSTVYRNYGKRGILVCDEWLSNRNAFIEWGIINCQDVSLSLDRIDNDKGYSPENCRWATDREQANNRRSNKLITYESETKTLAEWSRDPRCEVSEAAFYKRIYDGAKLPDAFIKNEIKTIVIFNEQKTINDWSHDTRCAVSVKIFRDRLGKGWDPEKALTTTKVDVKKYEAFGESKTLSEWAVDERCPISFTGLKDRIYRGMTFLEAITTPKQRKK